MLHEKCEVLPRQVLPAATDAVVLLLQPQITWVLGSRRFQCAGSL